MNNTSTNPGSPAATEPIETVGNLSNSPTESTDSQKQSLSNLPPDKAFELLTQDPVGFIQKIVGDAAEYHLAILKEQAELNGAISAFQRIHPEFQRFQQFILQEAATLLQSDDSVATSTWPQILEKAMENFKQKLTQTVQESQMTNSSSAQNPPYMEGSANRVITPEPATFTRDQIGRMSMQDFLKNEAAINEALKNNRIK